MEPWELEGVEVVRLVKEGKLSAAESVESHLSRIDSINDRLNAIVLRTDDDARSTANAIDDQTINGPLTGVVITTKINTDHAPYPTTNGIKALSDNVAQAIHPCIQGLLSAGGAMVGRTNSPAMAMRLHTDNELHGETLNPYRLDITCGGSSGGAAVAVATGMCHVAQGNDVAGSVRWPAFQNGVIGLRPTIGRLPTGGTNRMARSWTATNLSTNGPIARTMSDLELAYLAMCTPNWSDPSWTPVPHEFPRSDEPVMVGVVLEDGHGIDPAIRAVLRQAADVLSNSGYDVVEVQPPMLDEFFSLWKRLCAPDMLIGLMGMLPDVDDKGLSTMWRNWAQTFPPPTVETFMQAVLERDRVMREWTSFYEKFPVLLSPLVASGTFARNGDILHPKSMDEFDEVGRWGINLTTLAVPALAYPMGVHDEAPTGIQVSSRAWREDLLLQVGHHLENARGKVKPVDIAW